MLDKQREINETLSNESDLRSTDLQQQLHELKEHNNGLVKAKDKAFKNAQCQQEAVENYSQIVNKLEQERIELLKELQNTRTELQMLQNEKMYMETRSSESDEGESTNGRKDSTDLKGKASSSIEQKVSSSKTENANRKHRLKIARIIQEGFQKLKEKK